MFSCQVTPMSGAEIQFASQCKCAIEYSDPVRKLKTQVLLSIEMYFF